jgi:hypothetical protein
MSTTWSEPVHWILTALPVQAAGAVLSWTDYRECGCGHRVPAAVTEVFPPRSFNDGIQRLRSHMLQPGPGAS